MERFKGLSRPSRAIFWLFLIALVAGALYAIFSTQLGQNVLLLCCGGGILIAIIGAISEGGMRRR
jgi:hypothetical protein